LTKFAFISLSRYIYTQIISMIKIIIKCVSYQMRKCENSQVRKWKMHKFVVR